MQRTYAASAVAFAIEMFGVPTSMYTLGWLFGIWLPEGIPCGHAPGQYIGVMSAGTAVTLVGVALVLTSWRDDSRRLLEQGQGSLVPWGISRYGRRPRYPGFYRVGRCSDGYRCRSRCCTLFWRFWTIESRSGKGYGSRVRRCRSRVQEEDQDVPAVCTGICPIKNVQRGYPEADGQPLECRGPHERDRCSDSASSGAPDRVRVGTSGSRSAALPILDKIPARVYPRDLFRFPPRYPGSPPFPGIHPGPSSPARVPHTTRRIS